MYNYVSIKHFQYITKGKILVEYLLPLFDTPSPHLPATLHLCPHSLLLACLQPLYSVCLGGSPVSTFSLLELSKVSRSLPDLLHIHLQSTLTLVPINVLSTQQKFNHTCSAKSESLFLLVNMHTVFTSTIPASSNKKYSCVPLWAFGQSISSKERK